MSTPVKSALLVTVMTGCSAGTDMSLLQPAVVPAAQPEEGGSAGDRIPEDVAIAPVTLHLSYRERIIVPEGSEITIEGPGDLRVVTRVTGGLPYVVEVPIRADAQYPLVLGIRLASQYGHVMTGTVQLTEPQDAPVPVLIATAT